MKPLHSIKRRLQRRRSNDFAPSRGEATDEASSPEIHSTHVAPYEWLAAFDHSNAPVFVHDRDQRILRCNDVYAAVAGVSVSQIVGKPYWHVLPKSTASPLACDVGRPHAEDETFVADDGRVFAMRTAAVPDPNGDFWYCLHRLEQIAARNDAPPALALEQATMNAILDCAPSAFFLVDQDARLVRWNSYVQRRSGLTDEQLLGYSALSLLHEDDRSLAEAKLLTAFATGSAQMEVRIMGGTGKPSYFLTTARRLAGAAPPLVAGFCVEITDRKRAEQALAEQKAFYDVLVENVPGVFYVLDKEGNCLRWNSYVNKLTGLSDQDLYKRSALLTIMEQDRALAAEKLKEALEQGYARAVLRMVSKDRGPRSILLTGRRFEVDETVFLCGVGIDTTDQAEAIADLTREARTDALTELPNRSNFLTHAADEFERCRRYGQALSVSVIDLDNFKRVNDNYGHQAGDTVLKSFAATVQQALRDWDFVGRMGGEEFGVLLPETDGPHALLVVERLRQAVASSPVRVAPDDSLSVTVSIGIASMRDDDQDVNALLARADTALYEAKNTGRDKVSAA